MRSRKRKNKRKITHPAFPDVYILTFGIKRLYQKQNGACFYCARPMHRNQHTPGNPEGWTKDHFYPRSKGYDLGGNTVLACLTCNNEKGDRFPSEIEICRFTQLYQYGGIING